MGVRRDVSGSRGACAPLLLSQLVGLHSGPGWRVVDGRVEGRMGELRISISGSRPMSVVLRRDGEMIARGLCVGVRAIIPRLVRALRERVEAAEDGLSSAVWSLEDGVSVAEECRWLEDRRSILRELERL